jgi:hypothetical protein
MSFKGEFILAQEKIDFEKEILMMCQTHIPAWFDNAVRIENDSGTTIFIQFYKLLVRSGYIDINAPSSSFKESVHHLIEHPHELQLMVL